MSRRLDAAELADAAMSAALAMGLLTMGRLLAAGTAFQILATIVMAILAARRRLRVVAVSTAATMSLAILLGGIGPITQAFFAGVFGYAGGLGLRRRIRLVPHVMLSLAIGWPVVASLTIGFLALFGDLRRLTLDNVRNQGHGLAEAIEKARLDSVSSAVERFVDWSVDNWWLALPIAQAVLAVGYALIVRRIGRAVLERVEAALGAPAQAMIPAADDAPAPLPVRLGEVTIEHPSKALHLGELATAIEKGTRTALVGPNGSGKTSLMDAIAGLVPSTGIEKAGPLGLGARGGTAMIGQRPESQILGIRVVDDVRWGLDPQADADALLQRVGLIHLREQATNELSGGEMQRLAIAAALAREPVLLLSDESTSMLDPVGRAEVRSLLLEAADSGTAVLHSTHVSEDLEGFDSVIRLGDTADVPEHRWFSRPGSRPSPLLTATGVGFVHNAGTPWARPVLNGIDMTVGRGELTVVIGANGAGKTTLARILAGLLRPTEGEVRFDGELLEGPHPRIGIAFQHARLQLLRSRVIAEVRSLAGRDDVETALEIVGFDPDEMTGKKVDDLSGGQQRLVLLAGLIARACDVVVLDEPLAGLDNPGRERLARAMDTLLARGTGVVVVSHDPDWALARADAVVDLDRLAFAWGTR